MMKKVLSVLFAGSLLTLSAATEPLIRFGFPDQVSGKFADQTGHAEFVPGSAVKAGKAFGGAAALEFDGTDGSKSSLDVSKVAAELDGFDFSIAYQFRFDKLASGTANGLGLVLGNDGRFSVSFPWLGPANQVSFRCMKPVQEGKWHQLAFTYSVTQKCMRLYFDGELVQEQRDGELFPLILKFDSIGKFKGAIASLKIWEGMIPEEELTEITPDPDTYTSIIAALKKPSGVPPKLETMRDDLLKRLNSMKTRGRITVAELDAVSRDAQTALKLLENCKAYKNTGLQDAPFALLEVKTCSPLVRTPDLFPPDGVFTATLHAAAAKGEREPFSFILEPFEPVKKLDFAAGDFTADNGGTLPASILDKKVVKCWYQPNWNSYWNSSLFSLVPDLLLNDETLVKVDTRKEKNYLRVDYPSGAKYCDINNFGSKEEGTAKEFNFCTEPVRDAKTFQGVELVPFQAKQFVFTVRIPKDAKAGLYHSDVKVTADGKDAGTFRIELRVYPFELPQARTQYDLNEPFLTYMVGNTSLEDYYKLCQNQELAEKILRQNIRNMLDHQILHPCPALDERDLRIRLEEGLSLKPFLCAGSACNTASFRKESRKGKTMEETATPEHMKGLLTAFEKDITGRMTLIEKVCGHKDVYFYGLDEAADPMSLAIQTPFRAVIYKHGGKIMTSGWANNFYYYPSYENLHAIAELIDRATADRWHAIKCKLVSYAGPFAGPDDPDLMRRSHGMQMYRANYDGWFMLNYCSGVNLWNDRLNGRYRNFICVYITPEGPINTLAFTGLGEGQDDIRYMTLLRQLAEEAHKSGNMDAIFEAKKAVAWAETVDAAVADLDVVRMEAADHIVTLMKLLGKEVNQ